MNFHSINLLFGFLVISVDCYVRQQSEPLNVGFIFSLPYDISNTLRAPLAGPLSLVLGAGLALIMFFGILVSPISYLFGLPPRRYHIHDALKDWDLDSQIFSRSLHSDRGMGMVGMGMNISHSATKFLANGTLDSHSAVSGKFLDFMDSAFMFLPEGLENSCKLLLVCHAHGIFKYMPSPVTRFYHFVSRKLITIPDNQRAAIQIGFKDEATCSEKYPECNQSIDAIAKSTLRTLMSKMIEIQDDISENIGQITLPKLNDL